MSHTCPTCSSSVTRLVALADEGVLVECAACLRVWRLATVPEPYLRELISRSLELAALKASAL